MKLHIVRLHHSLNAQFQFRNGRVFNNNNKLLQISHLINPCLKVWPNKANKKARVKHNNLNRMRKGQIASVKIGSNLVVVACGLVASGTLWSCVIVSIHQPKLTTTSQRGCVSPRREPLYVDTWSFMKHENVKSNFSFAQRAKLAHSSESRLIFGSCYLSKRSPICFLLLLTCGY